MARRRKKPQTREHSRYPLPLPFDAPAWAGLVSALGLAPQEARVVECILRGLRDKQVAAALGIRFSTLRTYLRRIFDRLDVEDRVQLVLRVFHVARSSGDGRCRQN